jgi:hypothetical protein
MSQSFNEETITMELPTSVNKRNITKNSNYIHNIKKIKYVIIYIFIQIFFFVYLF